MLMMNNFGLIDPVEEQRLDASLFANLRRCATSLETEWCFGLTEVRAKDKANAFAAKSVVRQREIIFILSSVSDS